MKSNCNSNDFKSDGLTSPFKGDIKNLIKNEESTICYLGQILLSYKDRTH